MIMMTQGVACGGYPALVMTAQDVFKAMLREHIAPEMRCAGLKGSGQKYRLDLADHFALLGIQRASGSDAEVIRWTANVLAVSRADWSALVAKYPHHGDAPKHNYSYGNWDTRVSLLAYATDRWWEVRSDQDPAAASTEPLAAIREYGLPWLLARTQVGP